MKHNIVVEVPKVENINLELDEASAPKTVKSFLENLPFTAEINVWGEEIYTNETPIVVEAENAKPIVNLYDVAYWPPGKAICLFFGPTPIGKKGEIKPYSPVNVIGKIINTDNKILSKIKEGTSVTFKTSF